MLPFNCIETNSRFRIIPNLLFYIGTVLKLDLIGEDADDNIFDIEMQKAI